MKKDLTELVFILDRSGSMSGLESDTIGGYNSLLKKQKMEKGQAMVTTVLFDDQYEMLHSRKDIKDISFITEKEYFTRGTTALLDAVGKTISKIGYDLSLTDEKERPEKVIFVITTDGMENASLEFDFKKVRNMIKHQKEKYNWDFIFLGANIDAIETAKDFGIDSEMATNYHADEKGTKLNYEVLSDAISLARKEKKVDKNWKFKIEQDYNNRR